MDNRDLLLTCSCLDSEQGEQGWTWTINFVKCLPYKWRQPGCLAVQSVSAGGTGVDLDYQLCHVYL